MTDFVDEDTNPAARVPMHREVVDWTARMALAARHYKLDADAIRDFDLLLALAKGGAR